MKRFFPTSFSAHHTHCEIFWGDLMARACFMGPDTTCFFGPKTCFLSANVYWNVFSWPGASSKCLKHNRDGNTMLGAAVIVVAGSLLRGPGPCSLDGIWNALGSGDGAGRLVNLSQVRESASLKFRHLAFTHSLTHSLTHWRHVSMPQPPLQPVGSNHVTGHYWLPNPDSTLDGTLDLVTHELNFTNGLRAIAGMSK
jgi:hypothetical protein